MRSAVGMVMSIVLVGSGCSWIAVQGPPASDPGVRPVHCTETIIPPLLDTVPAVPLLGLAALLVAVGIKEHDNDVAKFGALPGVLGLPWAFSAWSGYSKTARCREMNRTPPLPPPGVLPSPPPSSTAPPMMTPPLQPPARQP
jgi:hypothetical protein